MTSASSPEQPVTPARAWQPVMLPDAPPPAGAYSPGVRVGDLLFVSGQVPRDPRSGQLVGDDITEQTRQVMRNVEGVLAASGATLGDLVSVTAYLTDVDDWGGFDAAYRAALTPPYPTRATVGVSLRGILVEISAIAHVGRRV